VAKTYEDEDGVWRTIGGRRVFIRNGQSLSEAMKESGKFSNLYKSEKKSENKEEKEEPKNKAKESAEKHMAEHYDERKKQFENWLEESKKITGEDDTFKKATAEEKEDEKNVAKSDITDFKHQLTQDESDYYNNLSPNEVYELGMKLTEQRALDERQMNIKEEANKLLDGIDRANKKGSGYADKQTEKLRELLKSSKDMLGKEELNKYNADQEDILDYFGEDMGWDNPDRLENLKQQIDDMKNPGESLHQTAKRLAEGGTFLVANDDMEQWLKDRNIKVKNDDIFGTYSEEMANRIEDLYKSKNESKQFEVGDLKEKVLETLGENYIDTSSYGSDLYVRKDEKSAKIIDNLKYKDNGLLTTFKDDEGVEWYDVPFGNMGDKLNEDGSFTQHLGMHGGTREYSAEELKAMADKGIKPMSESYTGGGWEGVNSDKYMDTKDQTKAITDAMKKKYPDVKISRKSDTYSGGSSIQFSVMESAKDLFVSDSDIDKMDYSDFGSLSGSNQFEWWAKDNVKDYETTHSYNIDDVRRFAKESLARKKESDIQSVRGNEWYLSDYGKQVMSDLNKEANSYTYSDSDGMVDYFDHGTYMWVNIGKYDKPYKVSANEGMNNKIKAGAKKTSTAESNKYATTKHEGFGDYNDDYVPVYKNQIDYTGDFGRANLSKLSNEELTTALNTQSAEYHKASNEKIGDQRTRNGKMDKIFNTAKTQKYEEGMNKLNAEMEKRNMPRYNIYDKDTGMLMVSSPTKEMADQQLKETIETDKSLQKTYNWKKLPSYEIREETKSQTDKGFEGSSKSTNESMDETNRKIANHLQNVSNVAKEMGDEKGARTNQLASDYARSQMTTNETMNQAIRSKASKTTATAPTSERYSETIAYLKETGLTTAQINEIIKRLEKDNKK